MSKLWRQPGAPADAYCSSDVSELRYSVYMLRCADGSLYTGIARDVGRRLAQHNGELTGGPKYTSGRRPVSLLWSAAAQDRSHATRWEIQIKRLSREDKLALVAGTTKP